MFAHVFRVVIFAPSSSRSRFFFIFKFSSLRGDNKFGYAGDFEAATNAEIKITSPHSGETRAAMREKNSKHMRDLVRDDPSTGEHMIQQNKKESRKDLETLLKLLGEHGIMRREKRLI